MRRWERASLGKLLSKVSVAEMERAGSTKRLPLLASVNGGDASGARKNSVDVPLEKRVVGECVRV